MIALAWPFVALVAIFAAGLLFNRWASAGRDVENLRQSLAKQSIEATNIVARFEATTQKLEDDLRNLDQRVPHATGIRRHG